MFIQSCDPDFSVRFVPTLMMDYPVLFFLPRGPLLCERAIDGDPAERDRSELHP